MTSKQSKTSLLSDKLEFEDVSKPRSELELDLPEEIMQALADDVVKIIRMQITIQVRDADKEWLIENKRILSDLFQIELAKLDLKELKTEQELEQARARMRDNLNAAMATDKIEAVLINEFLSQNKD